MKWNSRVDMTEGPLTRGIVLFSLPLIATNLLQVLFNMADLAVVGRFAGAAALGSVGSCVMLVNLFTGFLIGIGTGVNVVTARFLGAGREKDVSETVHTSFLLCLMISAALLLFGEGLCHPMLRLLGTKDELLEGAVLYLRIYYSGLPALGVFNFGNAVLSASGDTRRPLFYLASAGVLNIGMNLFTVLVLKLGVAGVAIASVASQYLSAVLILRALTREAGAVRLSVKDAAIQKGKADMILRLGIPSGGQNAIFSLANLFVQYGVNSFDAILVEGNAAAANADGIVYDVMAAFYAACSSFMSSNYGALRRERINRSFRICLLLSFFSAVVLGALLLCFGREFLGLFAKEPEVVDAGMKRMRIMCCSYAVSSLMDCAIAASRGLGRSFGPMLIVMLGSCVFRIVWVFTVFAHFHTVPSLYLLYVFSWTLTGIAEYAYYRRCRKSLLGG
ncbi:MAG: MATE family efflux transporter [Clostridia bacterium]|nr:MATE family efflux transporter [Clostridia bacterium]